MKNPSKWQKVLYLTDCIFEDWDTDFEVAICPNCLIDWADCPCPGSMQEDEYDYKEIKGVLYARKKTNQ